MFTTYVDGDVAYFCHDLSDDYVNLSDLYLDLSFFMSIMTTYKDKNHDNLKVILLFDKFCKIPNCHLLVNIIYYKSTSFSDKQTYFSDTITYVIFSENNTHSSDVMSTYNIKIDRLTCQMVYLYMA